MSENSDIIKQMKEWLKDHISVLELFETNIMTSKDKGSLEAYRLTLAKINELTGANNE